MTDLVNTLFGVFDEVMNWIIDFLNSVTGLFFVTSESSYHLTFLGTLAVISLGISVVFLLIRVIQNFLHFRG